MTKSLVKTPVCRRYLEDGIQCHIVAWARLMQRARPELALLHHIPNGGGRNLLEAVRLKRSGVLPGVPDLFLPCSRDGYHGLYLEIKTTKGRTSDHQDDVIARLTREGYLVLVIRDGNEGIDAIEKYLKLSLDIA